MKEYNHLSCKGDGNWTQSQFLNTTLSIYSLWLWNVCINGIKCDKLIAGKPCMMQVTSLSDSSAEQKTNIGPIAERPKAFLVILHLI